MFKSFGITRYNGSTDRFDDIALDAFGNDKGVFVGDYFNRIYMGNDQLLFAAYGGFNGSDFNGKINQRICIPDYSSQDTYLTGITQNKNQNTFIATNGGLHIYLPKKDKIVVLNTTNGFPRNEIRLCSLEQQSFSNRNTQWFFYCRFE